MNQNLARKLPKSSSSQHNYKDNNWHHSYNSLEGISKPDPPKQKFTSKPPTYEELAEIVRHNRNKSAPATNAVPNLVYKKFPQVLAHMLPIFKRIWKKKIPQSWRVGEAVLIPKEEGETKPDLFRNITLTNVTGKMFFQVLANRLPNGWKWLQCTSINLFRRGSYQASQDV